MKRDFDLVREILIAVEAREGDPRKTMPVEIPGRSQDEISYHVKLLWDEGLLDAVDFSHSTAFVIEPQRLTWRGHEFLDAARNDTVWNKVKEIVKQKGGSIPFDVLQTLLVQTLRSVFNIG